MAYRNYSTAVSHIVDANGQGDFTTIGDALTAAVSGQTIFIRPGTYTENPTLKAGVNLCAFACDAFTPNVIINGECSYSSAGKVTLSGIQLQTNSNFFLSVTGSVTSGVTLVNCNLNCLNNTGINFTSSNALSFIFMFNCFGNIATTGITAWSSSSAGQIAMIGTLFNNGGLSTTASNNSAGDVTIHNSELGFPVSNTSTGQSNFYNATSSQATNAICLTTAGNQTNQVYNCYFSSGSASAISVGSGTNVVCANTTLQSNNTHAITGSGTLNAGIITFTGSSSTINTTTVNKLTTYGGTII